MKRLIFLSAAALLFSLTVSSCSKCYKCSYQVEILDGQGNVTGYEDREDEVCTADDGEIKEREDQGHQCTSS